MSKKKKKAPKVQPITLKKYILEAARKLPIFKCWQLGYDESGIKHIVIARQKHNGTYIVGYYLIDLFCLGLKDTIFQDHSMEELNNNILENTLPGFEYIEIDPILAQNYVYGAIEYAEELGFKPHKDFSITEYILDDVEKLEYIDIELGRNGRPCFMPGSSDKVGQILAHLDKHVGEGNYDFIQEFYEDENDENESDFYEKLSEIEDLEKEEFDELLQSNLVNCTEDAKQIYGRMWLYTFAIAEKYPDFFSLLGEYEMDPKTVLEETKIHIKSHLQHMYNADDEFTIYLTLLSLENYMEYDGVEYLGLKAFCQAVEEFVHPEMENKKYVSKFMIPFEKRRDSYLVTIAGIISKKLYGTDEVSELNIFQINKVAKVFEQQIENYYDNKPDKDWGLLSEPMDEYFEFADWLPTLELMEIVKILQKG
jgi:hypothetical protein